ncbi:MAG: 5-formyltetrahydrofolate cyclo-ligase [Alphaproteobacteria bacterium]|nr:5-formyltetrahydrofolate cyclo-ligase [Alphaproteobacteria bacterium]MCB9692652.1 5-formyltetrahydrofolate cyclo-ligase [Alphaproteobacteria bacterium]
MSDDAKATLRSTLSAARAALAPDVRAAEAAAVTARVLDAVDEGPVFVFLGVREELPTDALVAGLRERFEVAVPRIVGKGRMVAARLEEPLRRGPLGIPTSDGPEIDVRTAILPGLAFDVDGGRLGYGGGYYDAWLAAHPDVHTLGIGFSVQLVPEVPMEAHDRRLHRVICGPSAAVALPVDAVAYDRTRTFDATTLPAGLLRDHTTKAGVWGRIVVEEGAVLYVLGDTVQRLVPGVPGIVPPTVPHALRLDGPVRLHVEFLRCPAS